MLLIIFLIQQDMSKKLIIILHSAFSIINYHIKKIPAIL